MNGIMMRAATLGGIDLVPPFLPRDSLDGGCERLHHRALAPMQHRRLDGRPAEVPVTKMSVRRLHVVDGPPVSYTHLRAHETPEHLVCRLLLEKKKKFF